MCNFVQIWRKEKDLNLKWIIYVHQTDQTVGLQSMQTHKHKSNFKEGANIIQLPVIENNNADILVVCSVLSEGIVYFYSANK